jgi:hypothetical protein
MTSYELEKALKLITLGTGSFPGVKWLGSVADHPPPSSTEVKKK